MLADAKLVGNETYPHVAADFRVSFRRLENIKADYVLPDHLVFAHPKGVTHEDPPQAAWFQRQDILARQLTRSKRMLDKGLTKEP